MQRSANPDVVQMFDIVSLLEESEPKKNFAVNTAIKNHLYSIHVRTWQATPWVQLILKLIIFSFQVSISTESSEDEAYNLKEFMRKKGADVIKDQLSKYILLLKEGK